MSFFDKRMAKKKRESLEFAETSQKAYEFCKVLSQTPCKRHFSQDGPLPEKTCHQTEYNKPFGISL